MRIVIASDHAGYPAVDIVQRTVGGLGHDIVARLGSEQGEPVDFPDVATALARLLLSGEADKAIMVCGTGIGAAMATNRFRGVRAALTHDVYSAHQAVEHDDANVQCLGAQVVGSAVIPDLVRAFLTATQLPDEEFRRRVAKLDRLGPS